MVRSAGAVPSLSAAMIRGDVKASGAKSGCGVRPCVRAQRSLLRVVLDFGGMHGVILLLFSAIPKHQFAHMTVGVDTYRDPLFSSRQAAMATVQGRASIQYDVCDDGNPGCVFAHVRDMHERTDWC
jgi:hypothetical protein